MKLIICFSDMRPMVLVSLIYLLVSSCQSTAGNSTAPEESKKQEFIDSVKQDFQKKLDSETTKLLLDTIGLFQSPVKIVRSGLNDRNVYLKWKNVSNKKIAGIRFKWYGLNAFNEPADMSSSSLVPGFGGGFSDIDLLPGKSDEGTWQVFSRDAKKIVLAWPYEVAFSDGTKWSLKN